MLVDDQKHEYITGYTESLWNAQFCNRINYNQTFQSFPITMRRPSKSTTPKLSADSQRLITLAVATAEAASRLEERMWERHLDTVIQKVLKTSHQDAIDAALEYLFKTDLNAYDTLMASVEAVSESCQLTHQGVLYDVLLIAAPVLAWTRFTIASGPISTEKSNILSMHLSAHLLAPGAHIAMAPTLFSIDQLPRTHAETYAITQKMAQNALDGTEVRPLNANAETAPFLADTRYLLAVIAAPATMPLFNWQVVDKQGSFAQARADSLKQWQDQAGPTVAQLLAGCGIEVLLPEAYYIACREADKQIRPVSIRAAVHYLVHALSIDAGDLRAVVAGFGDPAVQESVEEYRIGFTLGKNPDIIYGIIWPLYGQGDLEDDLADAPTLSPSSQVPLTSGTQPKSAMDEIRSLLQEAGITHIKKHKERFMMEFCDDCGAPLFADFSAELVHAEMPEDAPSTASHFH